MISDSLRPPLPHNGVPNVPLVMCRILNDHISVTGHPIHFTFGSRVGISGLANQMVLFLVRSWTEDIDKSRVILPFATLLWPLSYVYVVCLPWQRQLKE